MSPLHSQLLCKFVIVSKTFFFKFAITKKKPPPPKSLQTMRYNRVHNIPGNLGEIKALIHFPHWGKGGEKEGRNFTLGRCLTFNNLVRWLRVAVLSLHSSFPYGHLTAIQAWSPLPSWRSLLSSSATWAGTQPINVAENIHLKLTIGWISSCYLASSKREKQNKIRQLTKTSSSSTFLYRWVHAKSLQCLTLCSPMDNSLPGSSVHGILRARILEWAAVPSSRGSSWPRDRTCIWYIYLYWQVGSLPLVPPGKLFL